MSGGAWTKRPFIIAEIAQGYEGSAKLVDLYVKAAAGAGADAVKFQIFFADELALPDYRYYELFKQLELPFEVWEEAVAQAHTLGIEFYADVFGLTSLAEMERVGVDAYKIHATDIANRPLLEAVAALGKRVLVSVGGSEQAEVEKALDILSGCETALIYGFQAEPTPPEENNLRRLRTIKDIFKQPVGFQDHTAGDSTLKTYLAAVALGAEADIIEKHLTLSRVAGLEDYISALTVEEFAAWVTLMRDSYKALGAAQWRLSAGELEYRRKVNRAVCAVRRIAAGETIGAADIMLRRTDQEAIYDAAKVIGRPAGADIEANAPITEALLQ